MNDAQQHELSETGIARRNQMLKRLKLSVSENHQRKKRRRAGTAVAVVLTAIVLVSWQFARQPIDDRVVSEKRGSIGAQSSDQSNLRPMVEAAAQQQEDKPRLLEFGLVSGDEILDLLNEVGQPSALAEINSEWVAIPLGKKSRGQ
jgi:hypothetical protein